MKTLDVIVRDEVRETEARQTMATNNDGSGLFVRDRSGNWRQEAGNGQTGILSNPAAMMRAIRRHYGLEGVCSVRMVRGSAQGW